MAYQVGHLIAGRYRLERELARGGMGSVWAAHDEKLKRSVAMKLLMASSSSGSLVTRRRFEREAMAVAQLQSPHVVQVFDYGIEDATPFMVMELLEGEDLRRRLTMQRRLSLETAGRILVHTAKGLSVAHAAGIVHRDLKPGNIFLVRGRDEEIAKVLDFGVAKYVAQQAPELDQDTKDGSILGTPQFMAPEQARGVRTVDHRADLWSLGVILFKALTGQLPFNGENAADLIVRICTDNPPNALDLAPDLPFETNAFFARALARDPEKRFASAREMAVAFSRIAPVSFPTMSMPAPNVELVLSMMRDSLPGARPSSEQEEDFPTHDREGPSLATRAMPSFPGPSSPGAVDSQRALDVPDAQLGHPLGDPIPPSSRDSIRLEVPTSAVLRPSQPTLEGGLAAVGPSQRPPPTDAPPQRDKTWMLAVAAIVTGVVIAFAGNMVIKHDDAGATVRVHAAANEEKPKPTTAADGPTEASPKASETATARPETPAMKPASPPIKVADANSATPSSPPSATAVVPPTDATPKPAPPKPEATASPTPPKRDDPDPFSERL
jgi:serine/threonine-protein kinase